MKLAIYNIKIDNNEHIYTYYFYELSLIAKMPDFFVFMRFVMKYTDTPCCGPIENSVFVYNSPLQKT